MNFRARVNASPIREELPRTFRKGSVTPSLDVSARARTT